MYRFFSKQTRAIKRIVIVWLIIVLFAFINFMVLEPPKQAAVVNEDGRNASKDVKSNVNGGGVGAGSKVLDPVDKNVAGGIIGGSNSGNKDAKNNVNDGGAGSQQLDPPLSAVVDKNRGTGTVGDYGDGVGRGASINGGNGVNYGEAGVGARAGDGGVNGGVNGGGEDKGVNNGNEHGTHRGFDSVNHTGDGDGKHIGHHHEDAIDGVDFDHGGGVGNTGDFGGSKAKDIDGIDGDRDSNVGNLGGIRGTDGFDHVDGDGITGDFGGSKAKDIENDAVDDKGVNNGNTGGFDGIKGIDGHEGGRDDSMGIHFGGDRIGSIDKLGDGFGGDYGEEDVENLVMRRQENDVPVVIVDQHQEVIPYWYKAATENIISADNNTLIHIDGHSDMAPPDYADIIKKFISNKRQNIPKNSHLPLMQGNDRFIVSAIMTGLINRVIWIKPDWDNPKNEARVSGAFVGTTMYRQTSGRRKACLCLRDYSSAKSKPRTEYSCIFIAEDNDDSIIADPEIPRKACRRMKQFRYYILSESRFKRVFNTKTLVEGKVILDIDEDYFGVESGVQAFINAGVSLDEIYMINEMLSSVYCPKSPEHEARLSRELRELFTRVSKLKAAESLDTDSEIAKPTSQYFCSGDSLEEDLEVFGLYLKTLSKDVLKALSTFKYCNTNSQRLQKEFQHHERLDSVVSSFTLCHGVIFPNDTLNQIYIDSRAGITSRAQNLTNILEYIFSGVKPGLFTIARSLRDGYTPRKQQTFIEAALLASVNGVLSRHKLHEHIVYDKYLVFGKDGWVVS